MITYVTRYSSTGEPDDKGRWARIAVFKDIQIAWITKFSDDKFKDNVTGGFFYFVDNRFPTLYNDSSTDHKVCNSLQEAKDFVQERWDWFTNHVK